MTHETIPATDDEWRRLATVCQDLSPLRQSSKPVSPREFCADLVLLNPLLTPYTTTATTSPSDQQWHMPSFIDGADHALRIYEMRRARTSTLGRIASEVGHTVDSLRPTVVDAAYVLERSAGQPADITAFEPDSSRSEYLHATSRAYSGMIRFGKMAVSFTNEPIYSISLGRDIDYHGQTYLSADIAPSSKTIQIAPSADTSFMRGPTSIIGQLASKLDDLMSRGRAS